MVGLMDVLFWTPPLAMLAFVLVLAGRARRGERGWTPVLRGLLAISVLAVLTLAGLFVFTALTFDSTQL